MSYRSNKRSATAKTVARKRKQTVFQKLWSEATPVRKAITAAISTVVLLGSAIVAWGNISKFRSDYYVRTYGVAPHASIAELKEIQDRIEVIAQFSQSEINARQVQRQMQIAELTARCNMGRCTVYERQSLQNLMEAWQREQATLEALRRNQAQQQMRR